MMESALFLGCCCLLTVLLDGTSVATKGTEVGNGSVTVQSAQKPGNFTLNSLELDSSMIQRALYVLIGITVIGVLYFLVRAVRLKKSSTPRKKYGLLANYDDTVEMEQLESDDDDNTVYEAKSLRR